MVRKNKLRSLLTSASRLRKIKDEFQLSHRVLDLVFQSLQITSYLQAPEQLADSNTEYLFGR